MVMPSGLVNALEVFIHIMNRVFWSFLDLFIILFIDDILVYSRGAEEHESHLKIVLETLKDHQLFAKLSKCERQTQGPSITSQR